LKRALVLVGVALAGCFDFSKALDDCHASGRCADGGVAGGSAAGGGTATGGGTITGGGSATGGGSSAGGGLGDGGFPGLCADDVCWDRPRPTGVDWGQLYVAGPNDIWGIGQFGLLAHYDGQAFTSVDLTALTGGPAFDPDIAFWWVWGLSGQDVWATGNNVPLVHYDGTTWSAVRVGATPPGMSHGCSGIDGRSSNAVWVSCDGQLYLGGPSGVDPVPGYPDGGLDCAIVLADDAGVVCSFRPGSQNYSVLQISLSGAVTDLRPAEDVTIEAMTRLPGGALWISGEAGGYPYLATRRADGGWQEVTLPMNCLYDIEGLTADVDGGLLYACDNGSVWSLDGVNQRPATLEQPSTQTLQSSGGTVALGGAAGQLSVAQNGVWRDVISGDGRDFYVAQRYGDTLYAGGERSLLMQRTHGAWSYFDGRGGPGSGSGANITGLAITDAGFFIALDTDIQRRTSTWAHEATAPSPVTVMSAAGNDIFAATSSGAILHRVAQNNWSTERADGGSIAALWGSAPGNVFAVGPGGLALARNPSGGWDVENVATSEDLVAVTGSDAGVWALAADDQVYQRNPGVGWQHLSFDATGCTGLHRAIAAYGGELWIAGSGELCRLGAGANSLETFAFPSTRDTLTLLVDQDTLYCFGRWSTVLTRPLP
jgi:hypothetical protein